MELEAEDKKLLDSSSTAESSANSATPDHFYGSFATSSTHDDDNDEEAATAAYYSGRQSSTVGMLRRDMRKVNPANIMLSVRPPVLLRHESLAEKFAMAPTEMAEQMQLIVDPGLEHGQRGRLYYSERAYYNPDVEPSYALTVPPELYQQVFHEIVEARQVPCGLYFCCHGGDGAHTGVSHDDYVDIRIAWLLMGAFLGVILYLG